MGSRQSVHDRRGVAVVAAVTILYRIRSIALLLLFAWARVNAIGTTVRRARGLRAELGSESATWSRSSRDWSTA